MEAFTSDLLNLLSPELYPRKNQSCLSYQLLLAEKAPLKLFRKLLESGMCSYGLFFLHIVLSVVTPFLKLNIVLRSRYSNSSSFSYLPVYLLNPEENSFTSLVGSVKKYVAFFIYLPVILNIFF